VQAVQLWKPILAGSTLLSVCACGGETEDSPTSHRDAGKLSDAVTLDTITSSLDAALDVPLPDGCAELLACCSLVPQVLLQSAPTSDARRTR
jgi:hypothetical protein